MKRAIFCILAAVFVHTGVAQDFLAKAKVALNAKDTATAVTQFNLALKAGQKPAEVEYYLGAIAFAKGDMQEAVKHLEESVRIDDENSDALRTLASAHLASKNPQAALRHIQRAAKLVQKVPAAIGPVSAVYGKALLAVDSVDKAIVELSKAKETVVDDPSIYETLGDAFVKQNVTPMVVMNYQKAIELDPKSIPRRLKLASVYEKDRKYSDAVRQFDEIIKVDSTIAEAHQMKGAIFVRAGSTSKSRAEGARYFSQAIPSLATYTRMRPKDVASSVMYTTALFGAAQYAGAIKEGQRALKHDSSNVEVWHMVAKSQVETGAHSDAVASYMALKRRNALKAEDQGDYGTSLEKLGRLDEAIAALQEAVKIDSANGDAYNSLGVILMRKKEWLRAGEMFEKRIAIDNKAYSAYLNGAVSFMQVKEWPRARALLMQLVAARPEYITGRLWLARYYTFVDSLDQAKGEYDQVLKLISESPEKYKKEAGETHFMIGQYYFRKQAYALAVESFRRASSLGYDDSNVQLSWGQSILQTLDRTGSQEENRKKVDDAIMHFRRSIVLDQNNDQAHLWLGQALILARVEGNDAENKKLKDEACAEFQKVLRLNPGNQDAKKSMERIGCK